ncbi:ABC transporter ATP-binding protein [Rhodoligotrophos defluvii]|uniref:ABC transporter ATP-binding protein n=1 Tax=Rhodoligotrophos defluvii TaxID=2561934 RepID=UPI003D16E083
MLSVRDLAISFDTAVGPLRAVDGISFDVAEGEFFLIIGESGSGKTLTGSAIVGLTPPEARLSGSIRFQGRELLNRPDAELREVRGRDIGIVYQNPLSAMNPVWPVGDQIAEALLVHGLADRKGAAKRAVELLERVHLPDPQRVARAYPHEISGGMRQRAMIAMALACGPKLLIADEPTTALDVTIKAQVLELLAELRDEMGLTVILITHDMGVVAELADRILVMYAGRVAEIGPADALMTAPAHPYTEALMLSGAIAETPFKATLRAIPGAAPGLGGQREECRFHARCPRAEADCRRMKPPLRPLGGGEAACFHPLVEAPVPA